MLVDVEWFETCIPVDRLEYYMKRYSQNRYELQKQKLDLPSELRETVYRQDRDGIIGTLTHPRSASP